MHPRVLAPYVEVNAKDAEKMGIAQGDVVEITADGVAVRVKAHVNGGAPQGSIVLPRHLTNEATPMHLTVGEISKVK